MRLSNYLKLNTMLSSELLGFGSENGVSVSSGHQKENRKIVFFIFNKFIIFTKLYSMANYHQETPITKLKDKELQPVYEGSMYVIPLSLFIESLLP